MKNIIKSAIVFFLTLNFVVTEAQITQSAKYRIDFTDKHNTIYSLNNPEQYLSPRAIQRRQNQNIAIDSTDLPVNQQYIDAVLQIGGTLMHSSKWFNNITIALTDTSVLSQIKSLNFVLQVERTYPFMGNKSIDSKFTKVEIPEQSISPITSSKTENLKFNSNFNLKNLNYGLSSNQNQMIGIDYLHALGYTGEGMIISVLDAGFLNVDILGVFDSLRVNNLILGTRDFVNPNGNVYTEHSHGMAVLSTMAANTPGFIVGTAPSASYWLLRTEDANTEYRIEEDNWIAGAEFADSLGTDIINSSLGYTVFYDPTQDYTYADMNGNTTRVTRGANMAVSKGILVVNSAGNYGNGFWNYIIAPADGFNVLTVGAVDFEGNIASFSSLGPTSDGRIKPDVVAQGSGTAVINWNNNVTPGSGTSFSGPIIAGAVACLWQALPNKTNLEIIDYVKKSSHLYPNPNNIFGNGIPNFAAAYALSTNNQIDTNKDPLIITYPNPFSNELYLVFHSDIYQKIKVEIIDNKGIKLISSEDFYLTKGYNNIAIHELTNVKQGIYFLRIIAENKVFIKKVMKL